MLSLMFLFQKNIGLPLLLINSYGDNFTPVDYLFCFIFLLRLSVWWYAFTDVKNFGFFNDYWFGILCL